MNSAQLHGENVILKEMRNSFIAPEIFFFSEKLNTDERGKVAVF